MSAPLIVPFNHEPIGISFLLGDSNGESYTVAAGKYARATLQCAYGGQAEVNNNVILSSGADSGYTSASDPAGIRWTSYTPSGVQLSATADAWNSGTFSIAGDSTLEYKVYLKAFLVTTSIQPQYLRLFNYTANTNALLPCDYQGLTPSATLIAHPGSGNGAEDSSNSMVHLRGGDQIECRIQAHSGSTTTIEMNVCGQVRREPRFENNQTATIWLKAGDVLKLTGAGSGFSTSLASAHIEEFNSVT